MSPRASEPPEPLDPLQTGIGHKVVDEVEALEELLAQVVEQSQASPQRMGDGLRGRCAVVTGGASGIGRGVVVELGRQGVHVAFNYVDDGDGRMQAEAEKTAAELRMLEVDVMFRACDVRSSSAVNRFVLDAKQELGEIHILVNNAGIARDRALWRLSDEHWGDVIETNLTGAFNMIRAVAPIMRQQQYGKIVNVSSIHALRSEFGLSNYAASKAGLLALTRSAALELGPDNILSLIHIPSPRDTR